MLKNVNWGLVVEVIITVGVWFEVGLMIVWRRMDKRQKVHKGIVRMLHRLRLG